MRPPELWPLHPAPAETESLSSWLRRTAASYRMYSHELLVHDLGQRGLSDAELDLNPPLHLVEELARRTGLEPHRVSAMTLAGWVPWLLDTLTAGPDTYETYVHQLSVLLPPDRRQIYARRKWVPWLQETGPQRGCQDCLNPAQRSCSSGGCRSWRAAQCTAAGSRRMKDTPLITSRGQLPTRSGWHFPSRCPLWIGAPGRA